MSNFIKELVHFICRVRYEDRRMQKKLDEVDRDRDIEKVNVLRCEIENKKALNERIEAMRREKYESLSNSPTMDEI